jgi:glyoxylase-like metal-dependent hydrolase (beta-lactamase superfamily II)
MVIEDILDFGEITGVEVGGSLVGNPLMTVICYYVDDVLIDTGPYYARKSIRKFIANNKVEKVLLTHYHEDHAGNARLFVDKGIPVYGNHRTVIKLKERNRLKPYEYILFGKLEKVTISTLPEIIVTDRYSLVPIHTPGHSSDHTVYYEADQGWLFSGDLFLSPKIKYWRKDEDMRATISSLDRILKLDFEYLFCGHNPQQKNPKQLVQLKKQQLISLVEEVQDLLQQGFCRKEIVNILVKGKEKRIAKWLTLGDASYANMILAAIDAVLYDQKAVTNH